MNKISFNRIKNFGLAVLVAIQLWIVLIAVDYINDNLEELHRLTHTMSDHIESIHVAELAIEQAYNLFLFDMNNSLVVTSQVTAPVNRGIQLLEQDLKKANTAEQVDLLNAIKNQAVEIQIALNLYENELQGSSDRELYGIIITTKTAQIGQALLDASMNPSLFHPDAPFKLDIVQRLFQISGTLFTQLDTQSSLQPKVIVALLNKAEAALSNSLLKEEPHRNLPQHEMKNIHNSIQKIKVNLLGIYESLKIDPNMSYISDEIVGLRSVWDTLYMTIYQLSLEENRYLDTERQHLSKLATTRKWQLMLMFSIGIGAALLVAWLIQVGLRNRLNRLISGIEQYTKNRQFRIPVSGADMLCRIGTSFNQMAEDLHSKDAELKKTVEYLVSSQTSLHQMRAELESKVETSTLELLDTKEQLATYKQYIDCTPDGVLVIDADGVIVHANTAFTSMTGYDKAELIGRSPFLFAPKAVEAQDEWSKTGGCASITGSAALINRQGVSLPPYTVTWIESHQLDSDSNMALAVFRREVSYD